MQRINVGTKPVKHRFLDHASAFEVLDYYALQQRRRDTGIPDTFWINNYNGAALADAKTRSLASLHSIGSEEHPLTLQQRC